MSKITKIGKVKIVDNIVFKEEEDYSKLESYLLSRDFHSFISKESRNNNINSYEFIEDLSIDKQQKAEDLVKTMALLHNKTSFIKDVGNDKFSKLYDDMIGYINYLSEKYSEILNNIEYKKYPSPSEYVFLNNYYKFLDDTYFLKHEMDEWFKKNKNSMKERVCVNHGDIRLDHFIKNKDGYFISWGNNRIDSPILDFIHFYRLEWNNLDFDNLIKIYFDKCELSDDEKKLLFISMSIPFEIEGNNIEYNNSTNVYNCFNYLYTTEKLIGPYYTVKDKE